MSAGRGICAVFGTLAVLSVGPVAAAEGPLGPAELSEARARQEHVRADTDQLVRRLQTMLRVLAYHQVPAAAEQRMLHDIAGTLSGLSREQMAEVLARLEAAARAREPSQAQAEVDEAHLRHREILRQLRSLLARYDALRGLDQAADRLERLARTQLELHVQSSETVQHTISLQAQADTQPRNAALREALHAQFLELAEQGDHQLDLVRDLTELLKQVEGMRVQLTPEQRSRLDQLQARARAEKLAERMTQAGKKLRTTGAPKARHAAYREALDLQMEAARELAELARQLRSPMDRVAALRAARDQLQQVRSRQAALRADTQAQADAPTPEETATTRLANEQARVEFAGRDLAGALGRDADLADQLTQAAQAMRQAQDALRRHEPAPALRQQDEALQRLEQLAKTLDRRLAEAEQERSDPLASVRRAQADVERLLRDQADTQQRTRAATEQKATERLAGLSREEQQLAARAQELAERPLPARAQVRAALERAAQAMERATEQLRQQHGAEAQEGQQEAIQALRQAQQELADQAAAIEQRRDAMASLEEAARRLGELADLEGRVAARARDMAQTPEAEKAPATAATAKALAQEQQQLRGEAQRLAQPLGAIEPAVSAQVAEAVRQMAQAEGRLGERKPTEAAASADAAAQALRRAQETAAKAAAEHALRELADRTATQPDVMPAEAARQVAKALEQALEAAKQAGEAAEARDQKQALARSGEQTQAALSALAQAQAQAPRAVQPALGSAQQQLEQARRQLADSQPAQARQQQMAAAETLGRALGQLNRLAQALGQASAQPGQQPPPTQTAAAQPGQQPLPSPNVPPGSANAQAAQTAPSRENNQAQGNGNRAFGGPGNSAASSLNDVVGDGTFIQLPPRQRERIRQALQDRLPPEIASLVEQYYVNIARGRPAISEK
ncbi:MAG: hypothetical protein NZ700_12025 [Gemmataceae bacterium]|nr:hypothetical protein [Gemmataceae bacterium]MDW8263786.1 hypothetical protein [Gemmataceae bacterium]